MLSASVGFQCPECVKQGAATIRTPQAAYGGTVRQRPLMTQLLLGINVAMFVLTTLSGTGFILGGAPSELFQRLALVPTNIIDGRLLLPYDGVAQGAYYRLFTAMFLHFGVIHIALNMYCLYVIGPALENALGRLRFVALYVLSGLAGSALSYGFGPEFQLAAGASGAVFGLFAAFFVVQRRRGGDVTSIAVTIGINLFISFGLKSFIDWRGHVGGLIGGALLTAALVYAPPGKRRSLIQLLGCIGVAVLIIGVDVWRTVALS